MTNLHEIVAARPFALEPGAGERIWFTNTEMTIKATAAATDGHLCLIETYAPAGHGPPMHVHHDEHEAFYVLEGEVAFVCGGEWLTGGSGTYVFGPRGVPHGFKVVGESAARILLLCAPGGFEQFVLELGEPEPAPGASPSAPDMGTLMAAAARFDIQILGPLPE
jgi:quercetin dioxygenase-like cupin family protein